MRSMLFENAERQHAGALRTLDGLDEIAGGEFFPLYRHGLRGRQRTEQEKREWRFHASHFLLILGDAVVPSHPVRQQVIDAGALDKPVATAHQLERAALPQEISADAPRDWDRLAGL